MSTPYLDLNMVLPLIDAALAEDVGPGDATTLSTVSGDTRAQADILVKEPGVLCGLSVAKAVFRRVDPDILFEADAADGDFFEPVATVVRLAGPARGILTAERVALNFLQHLSGIATATAEAAKILQGTGTQILDTRKTLPGFRLLAKYAVLCGGGGNHRQGLFDMILIKENHIAAAGGIRAAIEGARAKYPKLALEVEVTSLDELDTALASSPDRVMLDNFSPERVREAMERLKAWSAETGRERPEVELSGGITLENLRAYGETGADFISSGAITHSVRALDVSLEIRTARDR